MKKSIEQPLQEEIYPTIKKTKQNSPVEFNSDNLQLWSISGENNANSQKNKAIETPTHEKQNDLQNKGVADILRKWAVTI